MEQNNLSSQPENSANLKFSVGQRRALGVLGALVLAVVVGLLLLRWQLADRLPALGAASFKAAQEKWAKTGPPDYDIEIEVTGSQPATYLVEVRKGEAMAAFRNGKPLRQRRVYSTWSVPGMFSTMQRDLSASTNARSSPLSPMLPEELTLKAAYDPILGYPVRYRRFQASTSMEVAWTVTKLEVKEAGKAVSGEK